MALAEHVVPTTTGKPNICFECAKACGGCSWSAVDPKTNKIKFEPVKGWTAEKRSLLVGFEQNRRRYVETYHITACPEFDQEKPRNTSNHQEISEDAFRILLAKWRRLGEF